MRFSKWEGLGNDFVVVDARQQRPAEPAALARTICDRHFGVGADGLALVAPSGNGAAFAMEIWNSDGSPAEMCGNALRCLAAQAARLGYAPRDAWFVVATASGPRRVRVSPRGGTVSGDQVEVDMGVPEIRPGRISMGNPHRVIPLESELPADWQAQGRQLELSEPGGINVEFVLARSREHLEVWVWERGAGPTLACGTGACAALVAMAEAGRCERRARVSLPGGDLEIEWTTEGPVLMKGPARQLFSGEWRPDP